MTNQNTATRDTAAAMHSRSSSNYSSQSANQREQEVFNIKGAANERNIEKKKICQDTVLER